MKLAVDTKIPETRSVEAETHGNMAQTTTDNMTKNEQKHKD